MIVLNKSKNNMKLGSWWGAEALSFAPICAFLLIFLEPSH